MRPILGLEFDMPGLDKESMRPIGCNLHISNSVNNPPLFVTHEKCAGLSDTRTHHGVLITPLPPLSTESKMFLQGKKKTTSAAVGNLFLIRIDTPVGSDKSD